MHQWVQSHNAHLMAKNPGCPDQDKGENSILNGGDSENGCCSWKSQQKYSKLQLKFRGQLTIKGKLLLLDLDTRGNGIGPGSKDEVPVGVWTFGLFGNMKLISSGLLMSKEPTAVIGHQLCIITAYYPEMISDSHKALDQNSHQWNLKRKSWNCPNPNPNIKFRITCLHQRKRNWTREVQKCKNSMAKQLTGTDHRRHRFRGRNFLVAAIRGRRCSQRTEQVKTNQIFTRFTWRTATGTLSY